MYNDGVCLSNRQSHALQHARSQLTLTIGKGDLLPSCLHLRVPFVAAQ